MKKKLFVLLLIAIFIIFGFLFYLWEIKGQEGKSENFVQKCSDLKDLRGKSIRVIGEIQQIESKITGLLFHEECPIFFPESYIFTLKPEKLESQLIETRGVLGGEIQSGNISGWKFLSIEYLNTVGTSIKVYQKGESFFLDPISGIFKKLRTISEKIIASAEIVQINKIPQSEEDIKEKEISLEIRYALPHYHKIYFLGPVTIDVKRFLLPLSGGNINAQTQKGKKSIFFAFSSEGISHGPLGTEEDLTKLTTYLAP